MFLPSFYLSSKFSVRRPIFLFSRNLKTLDSIGKENNFATLRVSPAETVSEF